MRKGEHMRRILMITAAMLLALSATYVSGCKCCGPGLNNTCKCWGFGCECCEGTCCCGFGTCCIKCDDCEVYCIEEDGEDVTVVDLTK